MIEDMVKKLSESLKLDQVYCLHLVATCTREVRTRTGGNTAWS
jgi:hypothetical protein